MVLKVREKSNESDKEMVVSLDDEEEAVVCPRLEGQGVAFFVLGGISENMWWWARRKKSETPKKIEEN